MTFMFLDECGSREQRIRLRQHTREEVVAALRTCGFLIERAWGDYTGAPYGSYTRNLVSSEMYAGATAPMWEDTLRIT